jgi:large subunit ribosomal protein L35
LFIPFVPFYPFIPFHPFLLPLYIRPPAPYPLLHLMGKLKSHSGAKKRVRKTGGGRIALKRSGRGHLLMQKKKRQKRLNRTLIVSSREHRSIEGLLPYL